MVTALFMLVYGIWIFLTIKFYSKLKKDPVNAWKYRAGTVGICVLLLVISIMEQIGLLVSILFIVLIAMNGYITTRLYLDRHKLDVVD